MQQLAADQPGARPVQVQLGGFIFGKDAGYHAVLLFAFKPCGFGKGNFRALFESLSVRPKFIGSVCRRPKFQRGGPFCTPVIVPEGIFDKTLRMRSFITNGFQFH